MRMLTSEKWNWRGFLSCLTAVCVWQEICDLRWVENGILPAPSEVFSSILNLVRTGELLNDAVVSISRVFIGFLVSTCVAVTLGILVAASSRFRSYFSPIIEFLRPIPPVAFVPISIMWFGIGNGPAFFLVSFGAFFPIFTNTWLGVRSVSSLHREAASALGANRLLMLTDVILPGATPHILAGLRTGLGTAWFCVIVAELVGAQSGLGYLIQLSRLTLQSDKVIAGMVVIGALGYLMNRLMGKLESWLTPWRQASA